MRNTLRQYALVALVACGLITAADAHARVKVVSSTADLAYFAREIGGDLVETKSIASPTADVHFVEVRPSYMVKVKNADIVLKAGLELDLWMDQVIGGSHNSNLLIVDCSRYIEPLEVPAYKVDARHGDIHRFGNPHYWLTPRNVKPITDAIVEGLSQVDPENAERYRERQTQFLARLQSNLADLQELLSQLKGVQIVTYHNSWPYFNDYVGLVAVEFVEPYPGVPPSPSHIKDLSAIIKDRSVRIIGIEPYFDRRVPELLAETTGARVVTLYPSVGGRDTDESYIDWLRGNLEALVEALK